ncbi:asparagine synthase (glutamine-hydrolyzing) [Legionella drancourtii]|uniref:asparagine synthase (glutamine-hydrolyzing) n=1 Tax=Legionella drancourtii LLAP12 TaxID=658187 RepID=G9ETR5_9GAMM|nr:asparagine synthase (glutamine-hydrolyzing) [Legionella drancourtii]EHL29266.1 asparagine synthase, glutamine-hydrolyzing [Legionella drancourtii LLAP12]
MCGFSGVLSRVDWSSMAEQLLSAMSQSIAHRGPDDHGIWFDPQAGIGLAHTRLAIVDLSPAGHQPMLSTNGRYVIAFNGEIYNHLTLREQLNSSDTWRGHSDTETLLAGFSVWGIEQTIARSVGMFAFAVWDKQLQILTLGRDRAGEKPLYYGWQDEVFLFGSELKALKVHPGFKKELNHDALALFLRHNYIPAPHSIYKDIHKLAPGTLLRLSLKNPQPTITNYWSAAQKAVAGSAASFKGDAVELVDELERLAKAAIAQQMIADVPLGAFLSGGIDSSTVVALMQAQSSQPVRTFSIGFHEEKYNEAKYAKAVAEHLGTQHTELYISTAEALDVIPKLSTLYDEPFSDSSQIPTFLVSELAKQGVTVALSGDAGDELFCGYNRYTMTAKLWGKINRIPLSVRKGTAMVMKQIAPAHWDKFASLLPVLKQYAQFGSKVHKGAYVLASASVNEAYRRLISHHDAPYSLLMMKGQEPGIFMDEHVAGLAQLDEVNRMMAMDFMSYLPDDILVKVDRAAMGVSLETRVPFLDHRLIEFAWTIPLAMKLRDGQSKWPLRQLLYRYVPQPLIERPKMGFAIPLHEWLRGPLQPWAEVLLNEQRLHQEGIFNPQAVRSMWVQHGQGKGNFSALLWNILMFQAWWEVQ